MSALGQVGDGYLGVLPNWGVPTDVPPQYGTTYQSTYSNEWAAIIRASTIRDAMTAELGLIGASVWPFRAKQTFWMLEDLPLLVPNPLSVEWDDPHPYDTSLSDKDKSSIMGVLEQLIKMKESTRAT